MACGAGCGEVDEVARDRLSRLAESGCELFRGADVVTAATSAGEERVSLPTGAGATGAPDAVDVVLNSGGRVVVVDHRRHVFHVKAARGDVCGDHTTHTSGAEPSQDILALSLRLISMHCLRADPIALQLVRQLVRAAFRRRKHQNLAVSLARVAAVGVRAAPLLRVAEDGVFLAVVVLGVLRRGSFGRDGRRLAGEQKRLGAVESDGEDLAEAVELLALADDLNELGDVLVRGELEAAGADLDGVAAEELSRDADDGFGPGRGEHDGLPRGSDLPRDGPQLRLEAHVQHAVRLVEHQIRRVAQAQMAVGDEIDEASGCADDDLGVVAQLTDLPGPRRTAEDDSGADARGARELGELGVDLHRELARRRQHHHRGPARLAAPRGGCRRRLRLDVDQSREEEAERLAAAGLGDADDVAAL
mmetsp:Transcript_25316/g.63322  ORF Transcript_25316/g.63322 Transcript_25316/m.63322 type:complete len:419 (-) Transcript_25316:327-1583(-)